MNWNDLRYILAIGRANSLAAAARQIAVDETTVGRRLTAIEASLGARLFAKVPGGRLLPTEAGEVAMTHAERIEQEMNRLQLSVAGQDAAVSGTVRLTSVAVLVNRLLLPALPDLGAAHPGLRLEMLADLRYFSLMKREADIALRLSRPNQDTGAAVLARHIGTLDYDAYAPAGCSAREAAALPWVSYDESMTQLPQAKWMAAVAARETNAADGERSGSGPARLAPVALNDPEGILEAVRLGLGKSLLPTALIKGDKSFRRLKNSDWPPMPSREIWLLTHPDQRRLARIEAVIDWLDATMKQRGMAA
ncbi:MAG TPA: LysR family transcriptional regulator [Dongiaceae bacterium]|nr:LysR family transcriptional regulator [Dongiaceae bacterium]